MKLHVRQTKSRSIVLKLRETEAQPQFFTILFLLIIAIRL